MTYDAGSITDGRVRFCGLAVGEATLDTFVSMKAVDKIPQLAVGKLSVQIVVGEASEVKIPAMVLFMGIEPRVHAAPQVSALHGAGIAEMDLVLFAMLLAIVPGAASARWIWEIATPSKSKSDVTAPPRSDLVHMAKDGSEIICIGGPRKSMETYIPSS